MNALPTACGATAAFLVHYRVKIETHRIFSARLLLGSFHYVF
jgi:hypothetical protein